MKTALRLLAVAALVCAVSCTDKPTGCFIHYTDENLDGKTRALKDFLSHAEIIPKSRQNLINMIESNREGTYEEISGAHPSFSEEFALDSIYDDNGYKTLLLSRKGCEPDCDVIFIHGGSFYSGFCPSHRGLTEALLKRLNARIYIPLYPLTPQYTVSTTMKMLSELYGKVVKNGRKVYIMGDSAGGAITLCFTNILQDTRYRMPDAIFPISPLCDYTLSNPELWEKTGTDITLNTVILEVATTYWHDEGMAKDDPMVCPLSCNVKRFPPTLMFICPDELMYADCMLMYEKLCKAGTRTGMLIGIGLWHVAPDFDIPVRDRYLDEVLDFIK